jgi:hypothetical protein
MTTKTNDDILHLQLDLRIQVVSDLHCEFYGTSKRIPSDIIQPRAPILALLGDIGLACTDLLEKFLYQQADRFEHVLFVPGNHEFYNRNPKKRRISVEEQMAWMRHVCQQRPNLHFMEQKAVEMNGILILGTTLWSHVPSYLASTAEESMNDFKLTFVSSVGKRGKKKLVPMTTAFTNQWHQQSLEWLTEQIQQAKARQQPVVVLTHHTPCLQGTSHPKYEGSDSQCCFSTDLRHLLQDPVQVWACGHTHYNFDKLVTNTTTTTPTRLVSNQRGYPDQDKMDYDSEGVVIRVSPPPPVSKTKK